ncbi:FadR/GntR family transcriptional regulator [Hwanghaeella sp.]|uniref:FadR/GntR family transcriptional regulator n=1 Tax=Hwanghaeella sp. TaxID=2605943 RepID=UPI003CCBBC33
MAAPDLHPIAHENLGDRVAAEVLRLIASGEFAPGDRLPAERRLAEMLGVSRVSVRAGLQQLKAQGLLTAVRGGGTRVAEPPTGADPALTALAQIDRGSLADLLELRSMLESWAARRAAHRADEDDIAAIELQVERMRTASGDRAQVDMDFHLAIAKASGSVVYRHLIGVIRGTLFEMLRYNRDELFGEREDDAAVMRQHEAIMLAIKGHDGDAAARAMAAHLDWVRTHYVAAGLFP